MSEESSATEPVTGSEVPKSENVVAAENIIPQEDNVQERKEVNSAMPDNSMSYLINQINDANFASDQSNNIDLQFEKLINSNIKVEVNASNQQNNEKPEFYRMNFEASLGLLHNTEVNLLRYNTGKYLSAFKKYRTVILNDQTRNSSLLMSLVELLAGSSTEKRPQQMYYCKLDRRSPDLLKIISSFTRENTGGGILIFPDLPDISINNHNSLHSFCLSTEEQNSVARLLLENNLSIILSGSFRNWIPKEMRTRCSLPIIRVNHLLLGLFNQAEPSIPLSLISKVETAYTDYNWMGDKSTESISAYISESLSAGRLEEEVDEFIENASNTERLALIPLFSDQLNRIVLLCACFFNETSIQQFNSLVFTIAANIPDAKKSQEMIIKWKTLTDEVTQQCGIAVKKTDDVCLYDFTNKERRDTLLQIFSEHQFIFLQTCSEEIIIALSAKPELSDMGVAHGILNLIDIARLEAISCLKTITIGFFEKIGLKELSEETKEEYFAFILYLIKNWERRNPDRNNISRLFKVLVQAESEKHLIGALLVRLSDTAKTEDFMNLKTLIDNSEKKDIHILNKTILSIVAAYENNLTGLSNVFINWKPSGRNVQPHDAYYIVHSTFFLSLYKQATTNKETSRSEWHTIFERISRKPEELNALLHILFPPGNEDLFDLIIQAQRLKSPLKPEAEKKVRAAARYTSWAFIIMQLCYRLSPGTSLSTNPEVEPAGIIIGYIRQFHSTALLRKGFLNCLQYLSAEKKNCITNFKNAEARSLQQKIAITKQIQDKVFLLQS